MIDENELSPGHKRKLNALRKSLGTAIADEAFDKWRSSQSTEPEGDPNRKKIEDTLWPLVQEGSLSIRRGGYIVRRGRGRVIVEDRTD